MVSSKDLTLDQIDSIFETLTILPESFRRVIAEGSFDPNEQRLRIFLGPRNETISENTIVIDESELKPAEIFLNLGTELARRGEGYDGLKARIASLLSPNSSMSLDEATGELIYYYLRGTFFMGGAQRVDPSLMVYGSFEGSRVQRIHSAIKDYFEGNEYMTNYNDDSSFGVLIPYGEE